MFAGGGIGRPRKYLRADGLTQFHSRQDIVEALLTKPGIIAGQVACRTEGAAHGGAQPRGLERSPHLLGVEIGGILQRQLDEIKA